MALLGAILLALFVLPRPWGVAVVAAGAAVEVGESWAIVRWSRRRRASTGVEAMVGARAVVLDDRSVRIAGERWRARGDAALVPGAAVEVTAVDGLTLVVREVA